MDCCEFRAHYARAAGAGWECAPYAPAPLPYAPYAYYPAPDPYRYYRYDYAHHPHHNDHLASMDYGGYASKEARLRRALARRDACALPPHHLPLPSTPPLDCGMNRRGPAYCEPPTWPHYQTSLGGWNGSSAMGGAWASRSACAREHMRYPSDCRPFKGPHLHAQSQVCPPDGRSMPYPMYEESMYSGDGGRQRSTPEFRAAAGGAARPATRERPCPEPRATPPEEKRPPVVPLPAFQQAFGSTEIGKFAEAFSRTEVALDESSNENFSFESFPEWEPPAADPQWSAVSREIKCEDPY